MKARAPERIPPVNIPIRWIKETPDSDKDASVSAMDNAFPVY